MLSRARENAFMWVISRVNSTGTGDQGEIDTRGPWNQGDDWVFTASPALQSAEPGGAPSIVAESSPPETPIGFDELLVDQLRDILHAEKQLSKALPKMAQAARYDQLGELFEIHLAETEAQVERLNECFEMLGKTPRANVCKGMQGLVEEGQEVVEEYVKKDDVASDLALIGAAQRSTTRLPLAISLSNCVTVGSFLYCQNRWQKKKTRISCSIRSRARSCQLARCPNPSSILPSQLSQPPNSSTRI